MCNSVTKWNPGYTSEPYLGGIIIIIIIIIRSASHTVALVQTKIATYTKKINLKSKSKYTKERFYLNQY